ncbi:aminodeoxychorismate/anthranilate synthase component II [Marivirga salinae]|uniref:Aminodeoxychorismate/anthranilate synthase component II n=1 Tax=Marivirga salinarum TaxID=3059078 RepID=A0AA51RE08_9BACT|nr:aminodeoxychorismate/anthranilate synthase component II [Marivirga sp. BDSF4-3]WMN11489.1 aminodeoxychorismate/anthranilate synthase component II [Marivirga sp. BDSF4-3]
MKILLLDNYDSFTYNLVEVIRQQNLDVEIDVIRNDKITVEEVAQYDKILLSPGPSVPENAGIMLDLIKRYASEKPILGICLGHQAIGQAFGGKLLNIQPVMHGIQSKAILNDHYLFKGVNKEISIGRYHSWVIDEVDFPKDLEILARSDDGQIMAVQHKEYDVCGLQFHPESVMTPEGGRMLRNWIVGVGS